MWSFAPEVVYWLMWILFTLSSQSTNPGIQRGHRSVTPTETGESLLLFCRSHLLSPDLHAKLVRIILSFLRSISGVTVCSCWCIWTLHNISFSLLQRVMQVMWIHQMVRSSFFHHICFNCGCDSGGHILFVMASPSEVKTGNVLYKYRPFTIYTGVHSESLTKEKENKDLLLPHR